MMLMWGRGEDGQLGLGDTCDQPTPTLVDVVKDVRMAQVACGSGHSVGLDDAGRVYTWGRGDDGRLGHGDTGWKYVPRLVAGLDGHKAVHVTCGSYHTAAVTDAGALFTWGGGMYGKLGHGDESGHTRPTQVEALRGVSIKQVACGSRHTVALTAEGFVYTWGDQDNGVAGHGVQEGHQYAPRLVSGFDRQLVRQVAACGFHTLALTVDGRVYSWGEGKFGRLGHGDERNCLVPTLVAALARTPVSQIACGGFHSAAVSEAGELFTWGGGEHGQLGHGDRVNKMVPNPVKALAHTVVVSASCGWSHTVALCDTGRVYTWGNGDHGKLGYGEASRAVVPHLLEALAGHHVIQIASYNEHTVALTDCERSAAGQANATGLLADMRKLINSPELSDVRFLVEGRPIHAHKAILSARSEHFRAMFASGMQESRAEEIAVPDVTAATFLGLLTYLYTGSVIVSGAEAIELYCLADLYTLEPLRAVCEGQVAKSLNVENAAALLATADDCRAARLRELCLRYVVRYFDHVSKTAAFTRLRRELIFEILSAR